MLAQKACERMDEFAGVKIAVGPEVVGVARAFEGIGAGCCTRGMPGGDGLFGMGHGNEAAVDAM